MMKKNLLLTFTIALIAFSSRLPAATVSGSISGESLVTAPPTESFSAGLNYDEGKRGIKSGNSEIGTLESRSYSVFLGYDFSRWCTFFATIGKSMATYPGMDDYGDGKSKWSIGVNANLWHINIEEPPLFTGRVSIKPVFEYTQYNSKFDGDTIKWTDMSGAMFLSYEKTIEDPEYNLTEFFGYAVYVGPAFSMIDGWKNQDTDFEGSRNFGVIGGLDFFITRNLSLGAQLQAFDELSFGGNARYHF